MIANANDPALIAVPFVPVLFVFIMRLFRPDGGRQENAETDAVGAPAE